MKAIYDNKPELLEAIGNSENIYRWDFKVTTIGEENNTIQQWECNEVSIFEPLSRDKITDSVIRTLVNISEENRLINNYNAALANLYDEETNQKYIQEYFDFINEKDRLKARVKEDCEILNIK